ncbi:MAG: hypothetical protein PVF27_06840 [Gemmatimonadales bacterium]|jgi:Tol biopolymer transport system component
MRRPAPIIPGLVLAAAVACGDGAGPDGRPISLDEGRGTLVSDPAEEAQGQAVWSPDGESLYYLASSGDAVHVSRAAAGGGGSTVLDLGGADLGEVIGHRFLSFVAVAPTGDAYVVASRDETAARGVLRVSDGADPTWLSGVDDPVAVALAPGGEYLLYGTNLSTNRSQVDLWSYDMASGTSTSFATGEPVAFSPDGAELLYVADDGTFQIATLASGATRPEDLGLGGSSQGAIRWTADGLQVLFSRYNFDRVGDDYYLRDVSAGTTALFYQESFDDDGNEVQAWSGEGGRMALWFQTCLEGDVQTCESFHSALYVVGVPSGAETWVAGVRDAQVRFASFSPDGGRVAYIISGQLYVSAVP